MHDDGTEGSGRDHSIRRSPTFATYSRSLPRRANPLRVSLIDCRLSRFDRNRGAPTRRPLRFPDSESNQFR